MDWPRIARFADAALVTALVVTAQIAVWTADAGALAADRPVHALMLAVVTVPLYVRRYRPLAVLLLVLGATWMQYELGGSTFQPWFAVLLSLYALGAHADRRSLLAGAGATAAARPTRWRSVPTPPSAPAPSTPPGRSPTSAPASPASCTTSSRTAWA